MPTLKVYPHGLTAGVPPSLNTHVRAKRGDVGGWSSASTRANTRFLYAIEEDGLTGHGVACTFTVRDCPPTHEDWKRLREALFEAFRRGGMIRCHWVTEWQRRGVPHLHLAVWFARPVVELAALWCSIAKAYRALSPGQHVKPIDGPVGWFQYVSKHAARGVRHYQRAAENIPEGWKKTGRMWGHLGDFPVREAMVFHLDQAGYFAFRRVIRRWRLADARAKGDARRIVQARGMLRCADRVMSEVRGVSEWVALEYQVRIVVQLGALGHKVEQVG